MHHYYFYIALHAYLFSLLTAVGLSCYGCWTHMLCGMGRCWMGAASSYPPQNWLEVHASGISSKTSLCKVLASWTHLGMRHGLHAHLPRHSLQAWADVHKVCTCNVQDLIHVWTFQDKHFVQGVRKLGSSRYTGQTTLHIPFPKSNPLILG